MPPLPKELTSLIHHVELNSAGWRERAIQQILLSAVFLAGRPLSPGELLEAIQDKFSVKINSDTVESATRWLCSSGICVQLPDERIKISENSLNGVRERVRDGEELEKRVKQRFAEMLEKYHLSVSIDETWSEFNAGFVSPLMHELGARTYELLSGSTVDLTDVGAYRAFLTHYPSEMQVPLGNLINDFFDPAAADVRSYILGYLNAFFLLHAGNLRQDDLLALANRMRKAINFTAFLDTNFLFSILGLHENPSNEAANALMDLRATLAGKLNLRLYVLPVTIDETKRTLAGYEMDLSSITLTPNLARVVDSSVFNLSGIAQRFVQEARKSKRPLSAKDYLAPYINNLIAVLRSKGVELYNENTDELSKSQAVIDDILEQQGYQERLKVERPKSYEALEHDIVLWHLTKSKRPLRVESPLDAYFWIVTVDFRFLGFDSYKKRRTQNGIPICVHPTILLQLLQFWSPRRAELETALLTSLRPMLPREFDVEAERVTISILRTLSRFERVEDLSEEAITGILLNRALRQRLAATPSIDQQVELVREALILEADRARAKVKEQEERIGQLTEQLRDRESRASQLSQELSGLRRAGESAAKGFLSQIAEERKRADNLEQRIVSMEEASRAKEIGRRIRRRRTAFVLKSTLLIGILCAAALLSARFAIQNAAWINKGTLAFGIVAFFGSLLLVDLSGCRESDVASWRAFQVFHTSRRWLFAATGAVFASIVAAYIYEYLRAK